MRAWPCSFVSVSGCVCEIDRVKERVGVRVRVCVLLWPQLDDRICCIDFFLLQTVDTK